MSLFVCERCNGIDNTALAPGYWDAELVRATATGKPEFLCTACDTGTWHGRFPRVTYDAAQHGPIGPSRRLHPEMTISRGPA